MSNDQASLQDAAAAGDLDKIKALYESMKSSDADPHAEIARISGRDDHPKLLEWCFSQGFKAPAKSFNDDFYHAVVSSRSAAVFQVLLNHGFDLNAHDSECVGDTLVEATREGDLEFTRFLLEHGQSPNRHLTVYPGELEAVTYAIAWEHASIDILKLLLAHGAELKETGAAIAAAEVGNLEALKLLVEHGVDLEEAQFWGITSEDDGYESTGTALYRACRFNQPATAEYLLQKGANGRARARDGTTCFSIARERGHEDIINLLQNYGQTFFGDGGELAKDARERRLRHYEEAEPPMVEQSTFFEPCIGSRSWVI